MGKQINSMDSHKKTISRRWTICPDMQFVAIAAPPLLLELEVTISPPDATEILDDYKTRIKRFKSIKDAEIQIELSLSWLNRLRHQNTTYEQALRRVKADIRYDDTLTHKHIQTECNALLHSVWRDYFLPVLEPLRKQRLDELEQEQEEKKLEIERSIKLEQEARRHRLWQRVLEERQRPAMTCSDVQRALPVNPANSLWGDGFRATKVLQTYTLYDNKMSIHACAVVDDCCTWLPFDTAGCVEYYIGARKLTVTRESAPLGQKLMSCEGRGAVLMLGGSELLVINIGGGSFTLQEMSLDAEKVIIEQEIGQQKQKVLDQEIEHRRLEAEKLQRMEQERLQIEQLRQEQIRQEQIRLSQIDSERRKDESERSQREQDQRKNFLQEKTLQARQYDRSASAIPYDEATKEVYVIHCYVSYGVNSNVIRERAMHLRRRCALSRNAVPSSNPTAVSTSNQSGENAGAGAIIGGILGLLGGPLGAMAGAVIGSIIGAEADAANTSASSSAKSSQSSTSEREKWVKLVESIDSMISKLPAV